VRDPARILIVDDTPTNVDILAKRLSAHGYEILTAGNGAVSPSNQTLEH